MATSPQDPTLADTGAVDSLLGQIAMSSPTGTSYSLMDTDKTHVFPFLKLPAEIRQKIYRYVLHFPDPIVLVKALDITSYHKHLRQCPLNTHAFEEEGLSSYNEICCIDRFTGVSRMIPLPDSVLSILVVSRQIYQEALAEFYTGNHFVFNCERRRFRYIGRRATMLAMHEILAHIGERSQLIGEMSFEFASSYASSVFKLLKKNTRLTKLHLVMEIDAPGSGRRGFLTEPGVRDMLGIRGLEVLDIKGHDRIGDSPRQLVDIDHPQAIGPIMREKMMMPREQAVKKVGSRKRKTETSPVDQANETPRQKRQRLAQNSPTAA